MSNHTHCLSLGLCALLALTGCGSDSFSPTGDADTDPTTDPATDHASDGAPDAADDPAADPLADGVDAAPDPAGDPVVDTSVDTGTDPFADPPAEGYPPYCGDDPSVCCSTPPFDCSGGWQCRDEHCMWICGDIGAFHVSCTAATDCDCYPAPVRCMGTWDCIGGTCWYFCDED